MARGAQCVLGNHELSVVRGKDKGYNRWFFTEGGSWLAAVTDDEVVPMATLPPSIRSALSFLFYIDAFRDSAVFFWGEDDYLMALLDRVQTAIFLPGEIIVAEGELSGRPPQKLVYCTTSPPR